MSASTGKWSLPHTPRGPHAHARITAGDQGGRFSRDAASAAPHAHFVSPGRRTSSLAESVTTRAATTRARICTSTRCSVGSRRLARDVHVVDVSLMPDRPSPRVHHPDAADLAAVPSDHAVVFLPARAPPGFDPRRVILAVGVEEFLSVFKRELRVMLGVFRDGRADHARPIGPAPVVPRGAAVSSRANAGVRRLETRVGVIVVERVEDVHEVASTVGGGVSTSVVVRDLPDARGTRARSLPRPLRRHLLRGSTRRRAHSRVGVQTHASSHPRALAREQTAVELHFLHVEIAGDHDRNVGAGVVGGCPRRRERTSRCLASRDNLRSNRGQLRRACCTR